MTSTTPRPTDFLRACLRSRFDPAALADVAALAAQPDFAWELVLAAAEEESVAPLLYVLLRGQPWLPAAVDARLHLAYIDSAARNTLIFHALGSLLSRLERAAIPVIVLKGAALAEALYGDAALRPMIDIDLLLEREQVPQAIAALQAAGYEIPGREVTVGAILAYENEVMLVKPGAVELVVELHWNLLDSPHYQRSLDIAWFWQTRQPGTIADVATAVLGPEAQLLHLCAHLALHHRMAWLLWQMDIAALLHSAQSQIDWELLLERTVTFDLVLATRQVLAELAQQWQAPIPTAVLLRLAALQPSPAEVRAVAWLTEETRPVAQRFWADLASLPTWPARLHYGWINLFPSAAYMRTRYAIAHPALLPAYCLYRWWLGARGLLSRK